VRVERTKKEDSHPERNVRKMRRRRTGEKKFCYISVTYSECHVLNAGPTSMPSSFVTKTISP
jgi:hypothetical protein